MKKVICSTIVVIMVFVLTACAKSDTATKTEAFVPAYRVSNTSEYAAAPDKGLGYRVVVIPPITDEELTAIFKEATLNDGYSVHTMWFYNSEEDVIQGANPVAMLEQKSKGAEPEVVYDGVAGTTEEIQDTTESQNTTTEVQTQSSETSSINTTNSATTSVQSTARDLQDMEVYIPKDGKRYHYDKFCSNGDYTPVKKPEAVATGYTPCKKCT